MAKRKRRYRIHWGRLIMFMAIMASIIAAIVYGIVSLVGWLSGDSNDDSQQKDTVEVIEATPQQMEEAAMMGKRIDSIMHQPMRLDTSKIAISIYDITTQQNIYTLHQNKLLPPASCMKIATAITAAKTLGLDHEYKVALLAKGEMKRDTLVGTLLLQADDDPLLETFDGLVKTMRQRGIRHVRGNVAVSLVREDTLRAHPTAKTWDIPYNKTPLLLKGKSFVERNFMATLAANGVSVKKDEKVKPAGKYRYAAEAKHKISDVITPMMIHSSNIKAECVLYHLDYKAGLVSDRRAHWDIQHATEKYLKEVYNNDSIHQMSRFVFNDGSGLSPYNLMTADFLVDMLKYAYNDKQLRDYFINEAMATPDDGLRRGSLLSRMQQPEYRGRIFCKTGTVVTIGASSLAGYLHGSDGHWYIFAIINTDSPVAESRLFQDKICKAMMSKNRVR